MTIRWTAKRTETVKRWIEDRRAEFLDGQDVNGGDLVESLGLLLAGLKPKPDLACSRCEGSGEEPGAPVEMDGKIALCNGCHGKGVQRSK
jgi:hypothetical protein